MLRLSNSRPQLSNMDADSITSLNSRKCSVCPVDAFHRSGTDLSRLQTKRVAMLWRMQPDIPAEFQASDKQYKMMRDLAQ